MTDVGASTWSEIDAANNAVPPAGWPEGMQPSDVNNSARANMGGEKRWWDRSNAVLTSAGATTAFTLTYPVAAAQYYDGEITTFVADRDCVAGATMNINAIAPYAVRKFSAAAWVAVANGDWLAGQVVSLRYNLSNTTFQIVNISASFTDFVSLDGDNAFTGDNTFTGTNVFSGATTLTRPLAGTTIRSYLAGLGTSNNSGTPNSKIDVAAGVGADDTNVRMLSSAGGTIDCGTVGANGLDAGALANNTWYYPFVIAKADGTMALLASTSLASPTFPSGYTLKRRVGAFLTDGSAHILRFIQAGDFFQWLSYAADINAPNPGASAVSAALTVPAGLNVLARVQTILQQGDASDFVSYLSDIATADIAPAASFATSGSAASGTRPSATLDVRTNTSRQIRYRLNGSNVNTTFYINTLGWTDRRGRDS